MRMRASIKKGCKLMLCVLLLGSLCGCKNPNKSDPQGQATATPTLQPDQNITNKPVNQGKQSEENKPVDEIKQKLRFEVQSINDSIKMETPFMTKEEFPVLDGSTANIPLGEEIYTYLTGATIDEARKDLKFYKTSESYYRLQSGEADILIVYEPSQGVLDNIADGKDFLFKPLGRDALVFIANEANPVNSLTQQQIIDIYSGKTTNWSEVGGNDSEILAFQRPEASGSQSLMEKLAVHSDVIMNGPMVVRPAEMGDLIDTLATYTNDSNALGYSVYYYANFMYTKPGLKLLSVDGIEPNNKTIQKQEYPYVNDFYVVIRRDEPEDSKARLLYDWLTTSEGQEHVVSSGYVPVIDLEAKDEKDILEHLSGTLDLGGNYFILHEEDGEGVVIGDSVVDEKFNYIVTFPGKRISLPDDNLVVKPDDIIEVISYTEVTNHDDPYYYPSTCYELYSLKEKRFISDEAYSYILHMDNGYYICYGFERRNDVISPDGELVLSLECPKEEYISLTMVGEKIFAYHNNENRLRIYDKEGKLLSEEQFNGYHYMNQNTKQMSNIYVTDTSFLVLSESDSGYGYLYDETGELVDSSGFLVNTQYAGTKINCWIMNATRASNGKLYVAGNIAGTVMAVCEDGTVLYESDNPQVYISFMSDWISVYDRTETGKYFCMSILDENLRFTDENNSYFAFEQMIIQYPDHLMVFTSEEKEGFRIDLPEHDDFWVDYNEHNKVVSGLVPYVIKHNGGEYDRYTYFKGHLYEDEYNGSEVGDYTILTSYENPAYVFDRDGNVIYKGSDRETVINLLLGNQLYLYVYEGNYIQIKDLDGNIFYRQYAAHLIND